MSDSADWGPARQRDLYPCYTALAAHEREGQDYRIHCLWRDSPLTILAPHGGGIEPGTLPLVRLLAGDVYNLYGFEGLKSGAENRRLHLTSHRFDEPRCLDLLARSRRVLVIHGFRRPADSACVGGLDRELATLLADAFSRAGIPIVTLPGRRGLHPHNLCNRGVSGSGVQLELGRDLRSAGQREPLVRVLRPVLEALLPGGESTTAP